MDTWIVSLISIVGSAIVTTIVSIVVSRVINKQFKKKDEAQAALEERRNNDRKEEINIAIEKGLQPVKESLESLKSNLDLVGNGALATLRNDILTCYYRCVEKGYRNDYDTMNMTDMWEAYDGLHGNTFVQDIVENRFRNIPVKEEFRATAERRNTKKNKSDSEE